MGREVFSASNKDYDLAEFTDIERSRRRTNLTACENMERLIEACMMFVEQGRSQTFERS